MVGRYESDTTMIRAAISGTEEEITGLVARLIRERVQASVESHAAIAEQGFQKAQEELVSRYANLQPIDLGEAGQALACREQEADQKVKLWRKLAHIVPLGVIQFIDFVSDVFVVVQLAQQGGPQWIIAVCAMGVSALVGMGGALLALLALITGGSLIGMGVVLAGVALALVNLHVLFVGVIFAKLPEQKKWTKMDEKTRMENEQTASMFVTVLKSTESGTESVVLALLTVIELVRGDAGNSSTLFWSSLALSALSMAYGFGGAADLDLLQSPPACGTRSDQKDCAGPNT